MVELVLARSKHQISFISEGANTFRDFLDKVKAQGPMAASVRGEPRLRQRRPAPKEWKKMIAALDRVAEHGFRVLEKTTVVKTWRADDGTEVCEIRKGNVRVLFFEEEPPLDKGATHLIITHAFFKKSNETPRLEVNRFLRMRQRYYSWKSDAN